MIIKRELFLIAIISILLSSSYYQRINAIIINTTILNPIADAYTTWSMPSSNHGYHDVIGLSELDGASIYLKFNLKDIIFNATILSAELSLFCDDIFLLSTIPVNVAVRYSPDNSWTELRITARNAPSPIGEGVSKDVEWDSTWYTWDIKEFVEKAVESQQDKVTLVVLTRTYKGGLYFSSREGNNPPKLII